MNQGRSKSAVQQWANRPMQRQNEFPHIMYDMPMTWKEKEAQRKQLLRNKKVQNWCFAIEWALIIGILWLVAPSIVERFF